MNGPLVMGVDVGTQGIRSLIADLTGSVLAENEQPFAPEVTVRGPDKDSFEQKPQAWAQALMLCLKTLIAHLPHPSDAERVLAIAVTGTSGTLVALDASGRALANAIMYNDSRSETEAQEIQQAGVESAASLGYRFKSSFALPKILWLKRHMPEVYERAAWFASPTDFINGLLCGRLGISDHSNMLKTGYDLINECWPDFLDSAGIDSARLPSVRVSGSPIGELRPELARTLGLSKSTLLCAGMTDGCASQVSTGAVTPGSWATILGTTLVVKGVSRELTLDPEGRIYSHRHPDGYWLPGGAGNVGAGCLNVRFKDRIASLDADALDNSPSGLLLYPLTRRGERFPFACPEAEGFAVTLDGKPTSSQDDEKKLFAAHLEGVAFIERLSFETLESLGLEVSDTIHTTGGGTRSAPWLQIRADILGRELVKPVTPSGAFGAAVLAASRTAFNSLTEAAAAMVRKDSVTSPRQDMIEPYSEMYCHFLHALSRRAYISPRRGKGVERT